MSGSPGRRQFLADIIAELSRQKLEDAAAFEGAQRTPTSALFKKLCFDFPSITDSELDQVYAAMRGLLVSSPEYPVDGDFKRQFCFNEKFMENIGYLCNADTTATATATVATESRSTGKSIYKIAVLQFLAAPSYMLSSHPSELSRLLWCDGEPLGAWRSILQRFHHVVHLSAVSTIASHTSNGGMSVVLPVLQDGALITLLCKAIEQLGGWVESAEQELSRRAEEDAGSAPEAGDVTSRATVALDLLDSLGAVGDKAGRFGGVQSLLSLLEEVLRAGTAGNLTEEGASRRALDILDAVLRVVKPCWLHLALFLRDIFAQYPQLLPAHVGALLKVLGQNDSASQRAVNFARKSGDFPSAVECMYVLVLSSLCASVRADSGASVNVAHTVACLHGKNALRAYLEGSSTLAHFVDICARMAADGVVVDKSARSVNIESVGFLIDAAVPFTCDPGRLSVNASLRSASAGAASTSALISSGLLPALLFNFLTLLEQQTVPNRPLPSQQTILLSDRLVQSLALLVLPASSPSAGGAAVLRYVLDFPDLLPRLLTLSGSWQVAVPSGSSEVFTPIPVFSEAQVLSLVSALLLGQLNTHLHPGGAALMVSAEIQEALLTAVTRGCTAVKIAFRQLVCLYRDHSLVVATEATPTTDTEVAGNAPIEGTSSATSESPGVPPPPTEADAAALRAKKLRATQLSAALQYLASLSNSLHLLAGEGACAPILRVLCQATGWKNANSTSTMCVIVQAVLVGFVKDALVTVTEGLQLLRSREIVPDGDDKTNKTSAIGKGSVSAAGHLENIKKQLKALQGLLSGGTSSKSD